MLCTSHIRGKLSSRGTLTARAAMLAAACAALAAAAAPALAATADGRAPAPGAVGRPVPVGHRQYFEGMVNGRSVHAVIRVVCGGPATTGHPQRGQKVQVAMVVPPVTADQGYTGTAARKIRVRLTWPAPVSAAPVRVAVLSSYGVSMPVPKALTVPCSGTGTMLFVPAPGSRSAHRAVVHVKFKSNGV